METGKGGGQQPGTSTAQGGSAANASGGGPTSGTTSIQLDAGSNTLLCISRFDSASCIVPGFTAGNRYQELVSDCTLPADPGPCTDYVVRYHWDQSSHSCVPFNYGGCGGNGNNFTDKVPCQVYCLGDLFCACPLGSTDCSVANGCGSCTNVAFGGPSSGTSCTPVFIAKTLILAAYVWPMMWEHGRGNATHHCSVERISISKYCPRICSFAPLPPREHPLQLELGSAHAWIQIDIDQCDDCVNRLRVTHSFPGAA